MSQEKTEAIVIRQAEVSESSRVVTLFSKDFGKLSVLAKGVKRLKGPFDAGIDLLSRCHVVFIRRSSGALGILTEARLAARFQPPGPDLMSLYGGYYLAELLNGLTEDDDPAPLVYELAVRSLDGLMSDVQDSLSVIVEFEIGILRLSGHLGDLTECTACGTSFLEPSGAHTDGSPAPGRLVHWVSQGGLLCPSCCRPEYRKRSMSAGSVAALRQLGRMDRQMSARVRLTKQQIRECHQFAVSAIAHVLGRRPKTLRYLDIG